MFDKTVQNLSLRYTGKIYHYDTQMRKIKYIKGVMLLIAQCRKQSFFKVK